MARRPSLRRRRALAVLILASASLASVAAVLASCAAAASLQAAGATKFLSAASDVPSRIRLPVVMRCSIIPSTAARGASGAWPGAGGAASCECSQHLHSLLGGQRAHPPSGCAGVRALRCAARVPGRRVFGCDCRLRVWHLRQPVARQLLCHCGGVLRPRLEHNNKRGSLQKKRGTRFGLHCSASSQRGLYLCQEIGIVPITRCRARAKRARSARARARVAVGTLVVCAQPRALRRPGEGAGSSAPCGRNSNARA